MKPGRKNRPIALRVLEGDPKLGPDNPVAVSAWRQPTAPSWLKGYALTTWDRLAPKLSQIGVLTIFDRDILALYCTLLAAYKNAVDTDSYSAMATLAVQVRVAAGELGLTPASRAGMKLTPMEDDKPKSGASKLLGGRA